MAAAWKSRKLIIPWLKQPQIYKYMFLSLVKIHGSLAKQRCNKQVKEVWGVNGN